MNVVFRKSHSLALWICLAVTAAVLPNWAAAQIIQPVAAAELNSILADPGVPTAGSTTPDVTVVEYFDYNCPFCKALAPDFHTLLATDRKIAVIYKEWPIFGGVSVYAAQAALATQYQGKYLQAHQALFSAPRLAQAEQVDDALRRSGVDMTRLKNDLINHGAAIDALLARNQAEARALQLRGTPGILVGRTVASGVTDLKGLQNAVGLARHNQ